MPTGYTYPVKEGKITDFHEFAWNSAQAMGAFAMGRDQRRTDPTKAPTCEELDQLCDMESVRQAETSLAEAVAELEELKSRTDEAWESARAAALAEQVDFATKQAAECELTRTRYNAMLSQVLAWSPPASLQGFKDFMVEQLASSLQWDCPSGSRSSNNVQIHTPAEFKSEVLADAEHQVRYHQGWLTEAQERALTRREWIITLAASLPPRTVDMNNCGGPRNPDPRIG